MLQFDHVSFRYTSNSKFVLNDVSFELKPGHIYGLLGKNGVGKSTFFRLICGLNPPSMGTVHTHHTVPYTRLPSMLSKIYLLPEEIVFPNINANEYGKLYGSFYPNFSASDLTSLLDEFNVDPNQTLKSMSQGQRKKAAIAFALACHTEILLMDEPTNGLDIPSKTAFRRILAQYKTTETITIISTHQVRDLEQLINAVIILDNSHIALLTDAEQLLNAFKFGPVAQPETAIYTDRTISGALGITKRNPDEPVQTLSELDLETLFNAAVTVPDKLNEHLH